MEGSSGWGPRRGWFREGRDQCTSVGGEMLHGQWRGGGEGVEA